jgi:hypothetical protein
MARSSPSYQRLRCCVADGRRPHCADQRGRGGRARSGWRSLPAASLIVLGDSDGIRLDHAQWLLAMMIPPFLDAPMQED